MKSQLCPHTINSLAPFHLSPYNRAMFSLERPSLFSAPLHAHLPLVSLQCSDVV